ncbi:sigma-70 family RNA polymerase sigma factor [Belliella sp. R4-6]|uniref:Sigma-70 family RNA polymerase sigma factor n=1 Tax=Belliella alkalica TaxID=1730871 RepID=A0ABS9VAQ5_9BACT|nr:sigma-70 family RNA polymerase sigma factor [Belliella alkalica]
MQKPTFGKPNKKKKIEGLPRQIPYTKGVDVKELLDRLQNGDQSALEEVYVDYRDPFLDFLKKYKLDRNLAEDIYQDAVLALFENAVKGKLKDIKSSIKTYLFAIGKYMVYKKLAGNKKDSLLFAELPDELEWDNLESEQTNTMLIKLQTYLGQLGEKCQEIIRMSYFEEKSAEEIVNLLGYPNKETLKSQKSRCIQHLKKKFEVYEK